MITIGNAIFNIKINNFPAGRVCIQIHEVDDGFEQEEPSLEFDPAWLPEFIAMLQLTEKGLK